jgi:hypothetical protein
MKSKSNVMSDLIIFFCYIGSKSDAKLLFLFDVNKKKAVIYTTLTVEKIKK